MYLKTLYIQGFKSFAQKTKIEFNNRVTGIVGPNGSGKSNITDAIMWVLGESSVKNLRGNKMEDVIFSGTDKKKPLGLCEVTIVFDNSDNSLPINYKEVSVTRKMYRSLESEYLINNSKCRLKDIKELFMDTGIGKDGYSLIGQGKIDSILSNKPEHRRNVFEEAAGISKYKMKKINSENKLKKTEENIIRLNDIILEIDSRAASLKKDSEKASKYLEIFKELKDKDVTLGYIDVKNIEQKLSNKKELIDELELNLRNNDEKINELKINISSKENVIGNLEIDIEKLQQIDNKNNTDIERKIADIELNSEKKKNYLKDVDLFSNTIEDIERGINQKLDEIKELNIKLDEYDININNSSSKINEILENIKVQDTELNNLENQLRQEDEKVVTSHKHISDIESKIEMCNSLIAESTNRKENLQKNLDLLYSNNDEINLNISDINNKNTAKKEEKKELESEISNINSLIKNLEKLNENYDSKLYKAKSELDNYQTKYRVMKNISDNYEGYNKSVKNFMTKVQKEKLFQKSLLGPVGDHISVDKKYEKAISIALGANTQNIIVKDESSIYDMISILNKNNMGRITFLPIDSMVYKRPNINTAELFEDGFLGFANDLISYDKSLENVFGNILGRIIIANDFKSATKISKKLNKSYRVVTLDGDSLNLGGSITGGSVSKSSTDILSRKNDLEHLYKQINQLTEDYNKLDKIHLENKNKLNENINYLNDLTNKYNEINKSLLHLENTYNNLISSKNNNETYIKRYELDIKTIDDSVKYNEDLCTKYNEELLSLNKISLNEDIDVLRLKLQNQKDVLSKLKDELTNEKIYNNELSTNISNINFNIKRLNKEIDTDKDKINDNKNKIVEIKETVNQLDIEYNNINDELNIIKEQSKLNLKDLELVKQEKYNLSAEIKEIRDLYETTSKLILEDNKKLSILNNEIEKYEFNKLKILDRLIMDYEIEEKDINKLCDYDSIGDLRESTNKLKKELKEIGNVNLLSIDEYKDVSERLEFNLQQRDDLNNSKAEIKNIIKELDKEMNEKFNKTFVKIQKYFDEIFKILFNGGKAEIEIEEYNNLESGIEIKAQPPGKRFQSLSLLSGGERALTAVALLFALLKVSPAPFCILDEIDAALDDANIKRYADYLMTLQDIQFIMITHRKITMEIANALYGVTMEEKGISKIISVELN